MRAILKSVLIALSLTSIAINGHCEEASKEQDIVTASRTKGKALFEEKCKTVAGEKIYRKVPDVEGILLLKVRPRAGEAEWRDPMWPGAAFAMEAKGEEYIKTFLGYEHGPGHPSTGVPRAITPDNRGYISTHKHPAALPGYRFVDVLDEKDGQRYRYTGRWEEPWQYDKTYLKGYVKFFLDKEKSPTLTPRYGVTYEDHVIPGERALGLASSTVKVIDMKTNEVMGEMLRYAWHPRNITKTAWLSASKCPAHAWGSDAATRKFIDQVLIPKKDN